AERNAETPEDKRILFRVGINLGDVIAEPNDIYGDGVNVAARLEGLAEPGGIYVSRVVRDQVRDKLDFAFEDMGEQQVKNIARPVRVHRVNVLGLPNPTAVVATRARGRSRGLGFLSSFSRGIYRTCSRLVRLVVVLVVVMIVACRWVNPPVTPYMLL